MLCDLESMYDRIMQCKFLKLAGACIVRQLEIRGSILFSGVTLIGPYIGV